MFVILLFAFVALFVVCALVWFALIIRKKGRSRWQRVGWELAGWSLLCSIVFGPIYCVIELVNLPRAVGERKLQARVELRKEFPIESLAARLQYETSGESVEPGSEDGESIATAEQRLTPSESQREAGWRSASLRMLHDTSKDEFLKNAGFGVFRMQSIRKEDIELPESPPIPFNDTEESFVPYSPDTAGSPIAIDGDRSDTRPNEKTLAFYHDSGRTDFLAPERMGYVKDREHVVGFQSHRFSKRPQFPPQQSQTDEWRVVRLELVSLLKHETSVAYVSKNLPRMDELAKAVTRPLDAVELSALAQLRLGRDVVSDNDLNTIRMLGSIRAEKSCLRCHNVRRGKLLGAFTYELHRVKPVQPPAANVARPLNAS